jgi:predicted RND superfamily exporter protein
LKRRSYNPYLRYPRLALAATLLLLAPLAARWVGFEVSTETGTLLEGDQRNLTTYQKVQAILSDDVVVVISLHCGPVFTRSGMALIRRVSEAFVGQPGLVDVKSFTHSVKPVRRGLSFDMVPLVSADPDEAELEVLRRFSLENPLIRNVMVSPDEQHTILLNTYQRDLSRPRQQAQFRQEIDDILAPFRAAGFECAVLGLPLIEDEIRRTLRQDLYYFVPAGFLVLLVILWLTFRSGWVMLLLAVLQ